MKPLALILTKEDLEEYLLKQRSQSAASCGLTIEEWDKAVVSGSVVTLTSSSFLGI